MGVLERIGRGRLAVFIVVGIALAGASFAVWYRGTSFHRLPPGAARPVPGETGHVQVEVLNASDSLGLARAATRRLRDAGLDVVSFSSEPGQSLDSTQVLVRRGDNAAGERVQRALGLGLVRAAPDATRLVDVTVRVGRDFARLVRNP